MKKKSSNLTPSEMRAIGWANRTPEQRAAHVAAMGKACAASMSVEQRQERARRGGLAKAANAAAKKSGRTTKKTT